jgi:hypothetical protein
MAPEEKALPANRRVALNPIFRAFVRFKIGKYLFMSLLIVGASVFYIVRHQAATSQYHASKSHAPVVKIQPKPTVKSPSYTPGTDAQPIQTSAHPGRAAQTNLKPNGNPANKSVVTPPGQTVGCGLNSLNRLLSCF